VEAGIIKLLRLQDPLLVKVSPGSSHFPPARLTKHTAHAED
jgi:hypothetical protein